MNIAIATNHQFSIHILQQKSTISKLQSCTPISPCWLCSFVAVKTCKIKKDSFDTLGINYSPKVTNKPSMTKIKQIEHFQICVHMWYFTTIHYSMYSSNHPKYMHTNIHTYTQTYMYTHVQHMYTQYIHIYMHTYNTHTHLHTRQCHNDNTRGTLMKSFYLFQGKNKTSESLKLNVLWMKENFKIFERHTRNGEPSLCSTTHFRKEISEILNQAKVTFGKEVTQYLNLPGNVCYNYSGASVATHASKYHITILVAGFQSHCFKTLSHKDLVSWNRASDICRSAGGTLPLFRSRDELCEFTALLKLSPYRHVEKLETITPSPDSFEIIFIGLINNKVRGVLFEVFPGFEQHPFCWTFNFLVKNIKRLCVWCFQQNCRIWQNIGHLIHNERSHKAKDWEKKLCSLPFKTNFHWVLCQDEVRPLPEKSPLSQASQTLSLVETQHYPWNHWTHQQRGDVIAVWKRQTCISLTSIGICFCGLQTFCRTKIVLCVKKTHHVTAPKICFHSGKVWVDEQWSCFLSSLEDTQCHHSQDKVHHNRGDDHTNRHRLWTVKRQAKQVVKQWLFCKPYQAICWHPCAERVSLHSNGSQQPGQSHVVFCSLWQESGKDGFLPHG